MSTEPIERASWPRHLLGAGTWRGRASSREFLAVVAFCLVAAVVLAVIGDDLPASVAPALSAGLIYLAISATARRFHDTNQAAAPVAAVMVMLVSWSIWGWSYELHGGKNHFIIYGFGLSFWLFFPFLYALVLLGGLTPEPGASRFGPIPPFTHPNDLKPQRSDEPLGEDAARLRRRMQRQARTTLLLVPAAVSAAAQTPGLSKLGGLPQLEDAFAWPLDRFGKPMSFLGQLDLGQVRAAGGPEWLPPAGLLAFFGLRNGWDNLSGWRVEFRAEAPPKLLAAAPEGALFPQQAVEMRPYPSRPSLNWLGVDVAEIELEDYELDQLSDYPHSAFNDIEPQHRVAGYPREVQDAPMALACEMGAAGDEREPHEAFPAPEGLAKAQAAAARKWRLLLQLDCDPALKMNWGGGGRLYFFVREKDASAGDFSRVRQIAQSA